MFNPVNWFEIAVSDMERAKKFYSNVLKVDFQMMDMPDSQIAMFQGDPQNPGAVGALMKSEGLEPSQQGTTVYFHCDDLNNELSRVKESGGSIIFEKKSIGEHGFIAQFIDSEGNRVALHSIK